MLKRFLSYFRIGYVQFGATDSEFWQIASKHIPFSYRLFRRSLSVAKIDEKLSNWNEWIELKSRLEIGDRICPFEINPKTMAMRRGYVVMRGNKPIGGVVVGVS